MTTSTQNNISSANPWLWIVATFAVLMVFWAAVVTIAVKNLPASVPLATTSADGRN